MVRRKSYFVSFQAFRFALPPRNAHTERLDSTRAPISAHMPTPVCHRTLANTPRSATHFQCSKWSLLARSLLLQSPRRHATLCSRNGRSRRFCPHQFAHADSTSLHVQRKPRSISEVPFWYVSRRRTLEHSSDVVVVLFRICAAPAQFSSPE
ncbi:hypothetical protein FA95DRAFT_1284565 [Auriscalpium vulgare]|uniref:Uncharacterized protein n=1 Tax=Auriscalpium vulgare TaxID=40419 RepID=A0ACB8R2C5_9AGAM|nr:hypothetical protein FA95DRAFT_1284565 [Auriscalpium vulgare]